jgi:hypothetical protein
MRPGGEHREHVVDCANRAVRDLVFSRLQAYLREMLQSAKLHYRDINLPLVMFCPVSCAHLSFLKGLGPPLEQRAICCFHSGDAKGEGLAHAATCRRKGSFQEHLSLRRGFYLQLSFLTLCSFLQEAELRAVEEALHKHWAEAAAEDKQREEEKLRLHRRAMQQWAIQAKKEADQREQFARKMLAERQRMAQKRRAEKQMINQHAEEVSARLQKQQLEAAEHAVNRADDVPEPSSTPSLLSPAQAEVASLVSAVTAPFSALLPPMSPSGDSRSPSAAPSGIVQPDLLLEKAESPAPPPSAALSAPPPGAVRPFANADVTALATPAFETEAKLISAAVAENKENKPCPTCVEPSSQPAAASASASVTAPAPAPASASTAEVPTVLVTPATPLPVPSAAKPPSPARGGREAPVEGAPVSPVAGRAAASADPATSKPSDAAEKTATPAVTAAVSQPEKTPTPALASAVSQPEKPATPAPATSTPAAAAVVPSAAASALSKEEPALAAPRVSEAERGIIAAAAANKAVSSVKTRAKATERSPLIPSRTPPMGAILGASIQNEGVKVEEDEAKDGCCNSNCCSIS